MHSSDNIHSLYSKCIKHRLVSELLPECRSSSVRRHRIASLSQPITAQPSLTDRSDWSGASRGCDPTGNTTHASVLFIIFIERVQYMIKTCILQNNITTGFSEALLQGRCHNINIYINIKYIYIYFTFTFSHLADAFIQSDLWKQSKPTKEQ